MLQSKPVRAVYLWPLVVPALMVVMVIVSRVVPPELEDAAVLPFEVALGAFVVLSIGGVLVLSIRHAYRASRLGAVPYVLFAVAVLTGIPIGLAPPWLAAVLSWICGACMVLTMPATFVWIVLAGRAAHGRPVPQRLDRAAGAQILGELRAWFQEAGRQLRTPYTPVAAPFGESPPAQTARIEQIHAFNAVMRAARVNVRPFYVMGRFALQAAPVFLLCCAAIGVPSLIGDIQGRHVSPKSSIPGDVFAIGLLVTIAVVVHRFVNVPRRELGRRVEALAAHLRVPVVAHDATAMLDWLDAHWADMPPSFGISTTGWHWMMTFELEGRPAMFSVLDDLGGKGMPRTRRIDLYLPAPASGPVLDDGAAARVRALGFEPVQSPAGLRLERRDLDPGALEPAAFDALLRAGAEGMRPGMGHVR
jgi:hypothetical protein